MQATEIIDVLSRALPGREAGFHAATAPDGMPTIVVALDALVETSTVLHDDPALRFVVLLDLVAIDFHPRDPRFELTYLLLSPGSGGFGTVPKRLRMKVQASGDHPHVPTVSAVWGSANWAEREVYDLYGVHFDDHPDLRRILMPEDWEGHPMRKDYPVQINQPVKTYSPLQVTEEQFVANIEAARSRGRKD